MKTIIRFFLAALMLLSVFSCQRTEPEYPPQPQSFVTLLQIYRTGLDFTDISREGETFRITWYDGSVTDVDDMDFDDCTSSKPKVLGVDKNNRWMIGGVGTSLEKDSSRPDDLSYPLYTYYTSKSLNICLTNGNILSFDRVEPRRDRLPVIRITSQGPIVSKEDYVTGSISIENPDHMYSDQDGFTATMKIKGRGNSTWGMPKKPYRIKLDSKSEILGMPSSRNWALLAEYADKSLLRNTTAMELSRIAGFSWTPGLRHVEVYLNGSYIGVYTLAEHKEVGKNKVNIDVEAGDIYFELEQQQDNPVCWWTEHGAPVMFSDPEEPSAEQLAQAQRYFYDFETALWAKDFAKVYSMIDLDSFVNYYIVQELTKNIDGNIRKSTFLTLPKGGKLEMYHVWDFDLTLGNCDYYDDGNCGPTGWWIKDRGYWGKDHGWYYRLFMDPDFVKAVQKRWQELYPEFQKIPDFITGQENVMKEAAGRNFERWPILSTYVWPNYKVLGTYDAEVQWLRTFYSQRLQWLDRNIKAL